MAARHRKKGNMVKPSKAGEPKIEIPGDEVMKEAKAPAHGFKRGGAPKKGVGGGMAEGDAVSSAARLDKAPRKARGGSLRGRSPMSGACNTTPASTSTNH